MTQFLKQNFNTLGAEITLLKPNIIVFSTGPDYDRHLRDVLAASVASPDERISEVSLPYHFVKCAIRPYHFRRVRNDELPRIAEMMIRTCA